MNAIVIEHLLEASAGVVEYICHFEFIQAVLLKLVNRFFSL